MPLSGKKCTRFANFNSTENSILLSLVGKYKNIIESKESDSNNIAKKNETWETLCAEFNSMSGVNARDVTSLRNKYGNLKKQAKRNFAQERYYRMGTGGGPSKPSPVTDTDEKLKQIIGSQITGEKAVFDSDVGDEGLQTSATYPEITDSAPIIINDLEIVIDPVECTPTPPTENQACALGSVPGPSGLQNTKPIEDWSTYSPAKLKKPLTSELQNKNEGQNKGKQLKSKLSKWAEQKAVTAELQKQHADEEHKQKMVHLREKHEKFIEECNVRIEQMKQKHELEMKLMMEESEAKRRKYRRDVLE